MSPWTRPERRGGVSPWLAGQVPVPSLGQKFLADKKSKSLKICKMVKIAALFVMSGGSYFNNPIIDPWDRSRDARLYAGPYPVIAHPPCERWGSYWFGGPSCKVRKKMGDDDGCFKSALNSVRKYGGVIEHPARTHAWKWHGINKPPRDGGWVKAGDGVGMCCHVEQGNYGHLARKPTWLYVVSNHIPELIWGPSENKCLIDEGHKTARDRIEFKKRNPKPLKRLSHRQRTETPIEFMNILIQIALGGNLNR